jgi:hypothetical protein
MERWPLRTPNGGRERPPLHYLIPMGVVEDRQSCLSVRKDRQDCLSSTTG